MDCNMTIWLVDDDEVDGLLFVRALSAVAPEHDAVVMETADECLERLEAGELPGLILVDWHLPPAGGAGLLAALAARSPSPVALVLSGSESDEAQREALAAGARAWLVKPTDPEEMRQLLRAAVIDYLG